MNNTPPNDLIGGWSAEFEGRETWCDLGGTFDHWWEAAMALIEDDATKWCSGERIIPDDREIDVGIFRPPTAPENLLFADDILDHIRNSMHDDYVLEVCGCDDYLEQVSDEQAEELHNAVRAAVAAWLDKHDLRPKWKVVAKSWTVTAGQAREAANAKCP